MVVRKKDTFRIPLYEKTLFLDSEKVTKSFVDACLLAYQDPYTQKNIFVYGIKDASFYVNTNK